MRTFARGFIALAVALAAGGCGGGKSAQTTTVGSSPARTGAAETGQTRTVPTSAAAPKVGTPVNQQHWQFKTSDGYSEDLTVRIYAVARLNNLPSLPYSLRRTLVACQADSHAAAVAPLSYLLHYTTRGFNSDVVFTLAEKGDGPLTVRADAVYGDGSSVCGPNPDLSLFSTRWPSVSPGATLKGDLYLILDHYFSPAKPNGETSLLAQTCLEVDAGFGQNATGLLKRTPENPLYLSLASSADNC
jgi:hypothetical protein